MSGMALRFLISSLVLIGIIAIMTRHRERDWTMIVMWTLATHLPAFILSILFPEMKAIPIVASGMLVGVLILYFYLQQAYEKRTALIVCIAFTAFKILFHTFWRRIVQ